MSEVLYDAFGTEPDGAIIVRWSKSPGDVLVADAEVVELQDAAKGIVVWRAPGDGVMLEQCAAVAAVVKTGDVLFRWHTRREMDAAAADAALVARGVDLHAPLDLQTLPARLRALADAAAQAGILLRPPASDAELDALETRVGAPLPQSFRALYRCFDGCATDEDGETAFVGDDVLLSLQRIGDIFDMWRDIRAEALASPTPNASGKYWHPAWIPFVDNPTYAHVVLDPHGCYDGVPGQIVHIDYKSGPEIWIRNASFDEWLRAFLAKFEAGVLFAPMSEMAFEQHLQLHRIDAAISPDARAVEAAPVK